jgi:hypothetical protein
MHFANTCIEQRVHSTHLTHGPSIWVDSVGSFCKICTTLHSTCLLWRQHLPVVTAYFLPLEWFSRKIIIFCKNSNTCCLLRRLSRPYQTVSKRKKMQTDQKKSRQFDWNLCQKRSDPQYNRRFRASERITGPKNKKQAFTCIIYLLKQKATFFKKVKNASTADE